MSPIEVADYFRSDGTSARPFRRHGRLQAHLVSLEIRMSVGADGAAELGCRLRLAKRQGRGQVAGVNSRFSMNVSKPDQADEPGYPDIKQFANHARKLGLAAVGIGLLASGCAPDRQGQNAGTRTIGRTPVGPTPAVKPTPGRTLGAFRPAPTPMPPQKAPGSPPVQTRGKIRVEPTPTPTPTPAKLGGVPITPQ